MMYRQFEGLFISHLDILGTFVAASAVLSFVPRHLSRAQASLAMGRTASVGPGNSCKCSYSTGTSSTGVSQPARISTDNLVEHCCVETRFCFSQGGFCRSFCRVKAELQGACRVMERWKLDDMEACLRCADRGLLPVHSLELMNDARK